MELLGNVKNYDWGKLGIYSTVAQLASANNKDFVPDHNTPYSELWMGSHLSGPARVKSNGMTLSEAIKDELPFLFKVLSIRKALSIQVHPNKAEAEKLHKERPDVYKDPNHKPELAIALTPFRALCGFRPINEIRNFLNQLTPLRDLIGTENISNLDLYENVEGHLKRCYEQLMTASDIQIIQCIKDIESNYQDVLQKCNILDVFKIINKDFPGDVGVLSIFFLNLLRLQPGQAIYLGANEIHAYLEGECIECMACSDNVIRAGLTPKYKDVNQLISCLKYECSAAAKKIFVPYRIDAYVQVFVPPVDDFAVTHITLLHTLEEYQLQVQSTGSILLTLQGTRLMKVRTKKGVKQINLQRGSIVYIPPEAAPEIGFYPAENDCCEIFEAYMAMPNTFRNY